MNPQTPCGHNPQGHPSGQVGQGNLRGQSPRAPRDRGTSGGQTGAATTGTPGDRRRTATAWVTIVFTLRSHGGPLQARVAAVGGAARPGATWLRRAGPHGPQGPQPVVPQGPVALPHVQADELGVPRVGRRGWRAMAMAVPSRRWLGGVSSPHRDWRRVSTLVPRVRSCARTRALLGCVEGLASAVTAGLRGVRHPGHPGRRGRPRLVWAQGVRWGHVVQRDGRRCGVRVARRGVRGTQKAIAAGLAAPHTGTGIKTAAIARLNATCRASLAPLSRRGRALAHTETLWTAGMWLVGCADPVWWRQDRLRVAAPASACGKWQARTPAMAAGLTNHREPRPERRRDHVPLPPWGAPTRRGRPPTRVLQAEVAIAA